MLLSIVWQAKELLTFTQLGRNGKGNVSIL